MARRTSEELNTDLDRLERLLAKPRTVAELSKSLGVTTKQIYVWLEWLDNDGVELTRLGRGYPVKYQIAS